MTTTVTLPSGRQVEVVLNSWLARILKPGSIDNGVTLSATTVRFARDWYTAHGIAHECGHTEQALAKGWRYLPWVAWCFVRYGYTRSPAEVDADAYMTANVQHFQAFGPVPDWAKNQ